MEKAAIKKILVPVDFTETSDIAVAKATALARLLKAELFFIHIIEFNRYFYAIDPNMQVALPSLLDIKKVVDKKMLVLQKKIKREFGIQPKVLVTSGEIPSEIIDYSQKKKIDLIIMGTHGASGFQEFFIGSNAQRVVTLSEIPVLTMQKKSSKSGFKNILIPIDNALHSREKVNLAMMFADLFGAKIHILGLPDSKEKQELDKFKIKLESVEKIVNEDNLPYKTTIVYGENLAKAALNYSTKNKCDLIAINTGHESKSTGIFLGAFAQQIVNHSKIPVLSFKHSEGHFIIETQGYGIS